MDYMDVQAQMLHLKVPQYNGNQGINATLM